MLKHYFRKNKANQPELDEAFVLLREQVAESTTVSPFYLFFSNLHDA